MQSVNRRRSFVSELDVSRTTGFENLACTKVADLRSKNTLEMKVRNTCEVSRLLLLPVFKIQLKKVCQPVSKLSNAIKQLLRCELV